ncbi:hypothetical protein SMD44_03419 [Streptomyces alboflavus]|uniref:Uncharacterized protein n=1 Tax=Streptomyces alboflavus TaxID=67267 RepID=A0A1Z1WC10_9ACTN|nr:hypothetical protein SMD44_03419 [Streptomyces alboflavus]
MPVLSLLCLLPLIPLALAVLVTLKEP